jgi:hypothetical protein
MLKECVVCGRFFEARGNSKTCSMKCGKERCRKNSRERKRKWYTIPENRERDRERKRKWYTIPENRERNRERMRKWYTIPENRERDCERNREKYRERRQTQNFINLIKLTRLEESCKKN